MKQFLDKIKNKENLSFEESKTAFEVAELKRQKELQETSAQKDAEIQGLRAKIEANEYALTYQASDDLTLGVVVLDSKDKLDTTNNPKLDMTVIAANYFIMPGLRVQASTVNFDYEGATNNDGSSMNVALRIDF